MTFEKANDILQEAEELLKYLNNDKSYAREIAFINEAATEIKRLREIERFYNSQKQEIKEFCRIIDERAHRICDDEDAVCWDYIIDEAKTKYREQAVKELDLQAAQEAGYVERLEIAFVEEITQALELIGADNPRQTAQVALAKIREGGSCH